MVNFTEWKHVCIYIYTHTHRYTKNKEKKHKQWKKVIKPQWKRKKRRRKKQRKPKINQRASLVVQWERIHFVRQGTWVWLLVQGDPTCLGATKPLNHSCFAQAPEPMLSNYWACLPRPLKPECPRARAPQQGKPLQWEAYTLQQRVVPACHD